MGFTWQQGGQMSTITIDVGPLVDRFEALIKQARAGQMLSAVIVCEHPDAKPSCNVVLTAGSNMPQAMCTMYLAAMELQVDWILEHKLNAVGGLLERKFADFLERMGLIRQEVVE